MIDADTFRSVLGRFASGVTIVTARDADERDCGMTVSAFSSLSLEPPLVLICVDHAASMHGLLCTHPWVGISILSSNQEAISRRFADPDENEHFDGLAYRRGDFGVVLLDDALGHMEGRIREHIDGGDHTVFIVALERAEAHQGRPLIYYRGGYAQMER